MQKLITIICFIFCAQCTSFFAQNSLTFVPASISERQGISEKFISHATANTDVQGLYETISETDPSLNINIDGKELQFALYENDLIAEDYFVTVASSDGIKFQNDFSVKTYNGFLQGQSGYITVTIDHDFFQAMINIGTSTYFIEQAKVFERNSDPGDLVFYNAKEVIQNEIFTCAVDDLEHINPGIIDQLEERVNLCRLAEVAIASDASMFTKFGSVAAVNNHNIAVLNNVAFNYRHEFLENIEFTIVTQYVSTTFANDPLSPNTVSTDHTVVYPAFQTWGNGGNFGVTFDEALFWTNRDFTGSTIGFAGVAAICTNNRYAILQDFSTDATSLRSLTAHEMGHNWGASHDGPGTPFIMAPAVNGSNEWSAASTAAVNSEIPGYACLSPCTGPVSAAFVSSPGALCLSGTVNYKDKSVNGATRAWTFTGGTPSASTVQQPVVTYSALGVYPATIIANGTSTFTVSNAVVVSDQPPLILAGCPLPTGSPGTAGLQNVSLADMFSTSGTAATDGSLYVDRTCSEIATLAVSTPYTLGVGLGVSPSTFETMRMYIDYNDNGVFDAAELEVNTGGQGWIGFVTFPFVTSSTVVLNQLLRMRIISSPAFITGPCITPANGQVEDFSVIFKSNIPLPVDLISFKGLSKDGINELFWVTKNESNMKRYTVERSYDGDAFSPIGYVASSNIQTGHNYTFTDKNLTKSGQWYYRLKMEDLSGAVKYSNVVFLSQFGEKLTIQKLVTVSTTDRPVSFQLISSQAQQVDISLFDMMGKMHSTYKTNISEGVNNMEFTTSNLPAGMYLLSVRNGQGDDIVRKVVIE